MYLKGAKGFISSFDVLKHGDAKILLVEECPCENKDQLRAIEGKYIRENECVNRNQAGRSSKQWREDNKELLKEKDKEKYRKNCEKIKRRTNDYYKANREEILEKRHENKEILSNKWKEYYESNKEHLKAKRREYYRMNREKTLEMQKELVTCECGVVVTKHSLKRHKKTKKHSQLIG